MMTIPLEFTSTDIIDESRLRMERYKEKEKLRKMLMKRRGLGGISASADNRRSESEERASSSNATPPNSPIHVINSYNNEIKDHVMSKFQIPVKDYNSLSKFRHDMTPPTPPSRKKKGDSSKDEEQEGSILIEGKCSRTTRGLTLFSSSVSSSKTAFSQLSSEAFSSSSTSSSPILENPPNRPHNDPFNNNNNQNQSSNSLTINDSAQYIVDEIVQLLKVATGGPQVSSSMPSPRSHASLNRTLFTSTPSSRQYNYKSEIDLDSSLGSSQHDEALIRQVDFEKEFDVLQKIGEGWFSRVYLSEYTPTGEELVIKMINSHKVTYEDFLQEVRYSVLLSSHKNILRIYDGLVFQAKGHFVFAAEYAPLGDLTSNVLSERGIGETVTKSITKQIGSALEWVHSKNLCHLDVKLDNILVFKSDFSKVKLCDFGSVRTQGDIVIKKNELLPYCPPELFARHANEYYQVDKMQDIFQFGIVIFFCLFGILPWQKADTKTDPHFGDFYSWRNKKSGVKIPKNFKPLTTKGQKFFKKILDPDPFKRLPLVEVTKYTEDKWTRHKKPHSLTGSLIPQNLIYDITNGNFSSSTKSNIKGNQRQISRSIHSDPLKNNQILSDGFSQLTMGSFRSVHSNVEEKNKSLYPLLQAGVETTVDRTQKNSRILKWIQSSNKKTSPDPGELDADSKSREKSELEGNSRFLRVYETNQEGIN